MLVPTTKPPTVLNNLTPGGTYTFQVRAYGKLGYSDWSDHGKPHVHLGGAR